MTDDPVEQALAELQDLVKCRCHPAYTGRGLRDPDCECDSAEALKVLADRIEAQAAEIERLKTYRKKTYEGLLEVTRIHDEVEAKLEKLIGGAETVLEAWDSGNEASFREAIEEMRADVAEAKGGTDAESDM